MGCARLVVRELRKTDAPDVIVFYLSAISTAGAAAGCAWQGTRWIDSPLEGLMLLGTGVLGYATQLSVTAGLRYARAAPGSAMSYLAVVWTLGAGWLLFGEAPSQGQLAGVALICGSTLALVWLERR